MFLLIIIIIFYLAFHKLIKGLQNFMKKKVGYDIIIENSEGRGRIIMYLKQSIFLKLLLFFIILILPGIADASMVNSLDDHWAKGDIYELSSRGFLDKETIEPDKNISRAEFTKMLVNCLGLKDEALKLQDAPSAYKDVSDKHPLKGYILVARERGIIRGYENDIFKPEEELSRDQMIALLIRVLEIEKLDNKSLNFTDAKTIPEYAKSSVHEAVKLGLVKGYQDNTFRPAQRVTWAEASAFINRWLDLKNDRYDYIGKFISFDPEKNQIELLVKENSITLPLSGKVTVLNEGSLAELSSIAKDQMVSVKTNLHGKVVLIHKKDIALSDIKFNITARMLPRKDSDARKVVETTSLFNPSLPNNRENEQKSMEISQKEIKVPDLMKKTGSDGKNQLIAVVDTGVDPAHPDLLETTDHQPKIKDWVDFTLEGMINTQMVPTPTGTSIEYDNNKYFIGDIVSKSRVFRLGRLDINEIVPLELMDFLNETKYIEALVVDSREKGVYDTVYIDVNGDKSFADEMALKIFRKNQDYVVVPHQGKELSLVVVDIDPEGKYIQVANDISGHGTHVAGIIAANGKLKGVAPGAQLMVLKAVDREGYANPTNIIEAIRYAAIHGADIINISLEQYEDAEKGDSKLAQIVDEAVNKYGATVVTAAGNIGPGLSTIATPADADKTISVGSFMSPEMWQENYNFTVPKDTLYYYSSIGPRKDGAWYPTIVAPAGVVSTVPLWMENSYMYTEGTSMSAPYVTGIVAHLLENADKNNMKTTPGSIKRALEESAKELEGLKNPEIGHGIVDAAAAWNKLLEINKERKFTTKIKSPYYNEGKGIYAREYIPKKLNVEVTNTDQKDYTLTWSTEASWVKPESETTVMIPSEARVIPLDFDLPFKAGLYSTILKGDDPNYKGVEVEIPINIVIGKDLDKKSPYTDTILDSLEAGELRRYFINVPEGTGSIKAHLEIFPSTDGKYQGRARMHLVDPFGKEAEMSDYAGLSPYNLSKKGKVTIPYYSPTPGTWELVVYSSASLSSYEVQNTKYQLTLELGDIVAIDSIVNPDLDIIVSPVPKGALEKGSGKVVLHIWDKLNNKPYTGSLEVNGRYYQISGGKLEYDVSKLKKDMFIAFKVLK